MWCLVCDVWYCGVVMREYWVDLVLVLCGVVWCVYLWCVVASVIVLRCVSLVCVVVV